MPPASHVHAPIITRGRALGDGVACGVARFIAAPAQLGELKPGEILLAHDITLDWDVEVAAPASIVTNGTDPNGHVAAVARRLGIPAVVGTVSGAAPLWSGARLTVFCVEGVGLVREDDHAARPMAQRSD